MGKMFDHLMNGTLETYLERLGTERMAEVFIEIAPIVITLIAIGLFSLFYYVRYTLTKKNFWKGDMKKGVICMRIAHLSGCFWMIAFVAFFWSIGILKTDNDVSFLYALICLSIPYGIGAFPFLVSGFAINRLFYVSPNDLPVTLSN